MALIYITDEAVSAVHCAAPSDQHLVEILNYGKKPTNDEIRWLAAFVLIAKGNHLNRVPQK